MQLAIFKTLFVSTCLVHSVKSENCVEKSKSTEIPKGLKSIPVVLVLTTLGSDVRLPCHYCSVKPGISGRIWRQRSLHGKEREVQLDMHDDPAKNRIFTSEDRSLVIRRVTRKDGAYYFCYDVEGAKGTEKMDILLDVEHRTTLEPHVLNMPADLDKEVPKWLETCDKIKRIPPVSKYECYADWGIWSKCDSCGKIGERKRVGECRLQKFETAKMKTPEGHVIEADFPIIGVGCHSVLLDDVQAAKKVLDQIPNLVLIEKCEVSCKGYVTKASRLRAFKKGSFLKTIKTKISKKMKGVNHAIKVETKAEKEGAQLTLFCPGASLDTRVKWKINEQLLKADKLKKRTAGRVYIDATDAFHIKELRITDAGEYICMLDDMEIGLIRLKVISKYTAFDPSSNFGILTLTMTASFILWSLLMALKWKNYAMQRKAQQMGRRWNQKSDTNEDVTESTKLISLLDSSDETTQQQSVTKISSSSTLSS